MRQVAGCSRPKISRAGRPALDFGANFILNAHFTPPPTATMSAALKDDIKSAMSGVGVTLSGDMLSKCEFRGLLLNL